MPAAPLPLETLLETLDLVQQHGSVSAAARIAGVPYATFQSRHRSAKAAQASGKLPSPELEDRHAIPTGLPFEREWAVWMKHIGMMRDRYTGPAKPKARQGRLRVVAAGDFHIPFHDREAPRSALVTGDCVMLRPRWHDEKGRRPRGIVGAEHR